MTLRIISQAAIAFVVLCLFSFATFAYAYEATGQQAFVVNGRTGIFMIQYKFGHRDHMIDMPVIARNTASTEPGTLSYGIFDSNENRVPGTAAGIVLSSIPIKGSEYLVPKGLNTTFTLFVLFTPNDANAEGVYHLRVTSLPFSFDGTQNLQLNPSELQYYKTKSVEFKPSS